MNDPIANGSASSPMRLSSRSFTTLLTALLLTAWIFFLRWPSFGGTVWNLDEGIHATIARTILDGGVMYRDAIDLRTPLSYYLVAGIFAVSGSNNLWAVHAVLAAMISATALGVFLLGRHWHGPATGLWGAAVFGAFANSLLYVGDTYAVTTEWFVILFTTWSAWWFCVAWPRAGFWPAFGAGLGYAAAFLCKQPALLDFGAPLGLAVYLGASGRLRPADAARLLGGLAAGFVALTAAVFAYFWWRGALADFYFYAWTYSLVYYGAEIAAPDRLRSAVALAEIIGREYPLMLAVAGAAILGLLHRLAQKVPAGGDHDARVPAVFLLLWLALSVAGAASAGRIYGHYYIQTMPPLALAAAWVLGGAVGWGRQPGRWWRRVGATTLVLVSAWTVVARPLAARKRPHLGPDAAQSAADFVRAHSAPQERIFVWGFNPDFYLFADRPSASRFIYCCFQTGLVPWTNTAPNLDTSYAIVPGALETLLGELESVRPVFFVDTSLATYRGFTKYPLERFPRLAKFVAANYVEVEPAQFRPHGFRVLILKDAGRRAPLRLAGGTSAGHLNEPWVSGRPAVDPVPAEYQVQAAHSAGRLQRLELLVDDVPVDGISFAPTNLMAASFTVHFEGLAHGRHRLSARSTSASGETITGPALEVECAPESLPATELPPFALPVIEPGPPPVRLSAPYGAAAREEAGHLVFFAHAPSNITYGLPADAARLGGRFGFRPGAYAADNPGRTDGAEFVITWISPAGQRTLLLRRLLRPVEEPGDRGEQAFDVTLPRGAGARLELVVNNGPADNAASDWTYWSDLLLTTSR